MRGSAHEINGTVAQRAIGGVNREDQLQRDVDVQGWVTKLTAANPARDAVVKRAKELMDTELLALSDDITLVIVDIDSAGARR